jgi:hypothetical protein
MATGQLFDYSLVTSSHIVKHSTEGYTLPHYGIPDSEIDNPRKELLLLKSIEEAWNRKQS